MAGNQNASMAIDHETKARLKKFTDAWEAKNGRKLSAKDFVTISLDYFEKTGIEPTSNEKPDPKALAEYKDKQENEIASLRAEMAEFLQTLAKTQADTNLKITAIGQRQDKLIEQTTAIDAGQKMLLEAKITRNKDNKELTTEDIMGTYYLKKMGDVFKVWRINKGLSEYAVSQESKINYRTIKNIEAGKDVSLSNFLRYMNYILANDPNTDILRLYKIYACLPGNDIDPKEREQVLSDYHKHIPDNLVEWQYLVKGTNKQGEAIEETLWIEDYTDKEERAKQAFLKLHNKAQITEVILRGSRNKE